MLIYVMNTVFLNEGAKEGWNGLYHYYHFAAENILGGFAALASVRHGLDVQDRISEKILSGSADTPERIVIPWEGGWRDKWGENELVIKGIFPTCESRRRSSVETMSILGPRRTGLLINVDC